MKQLRVAVGLAPQAPGTVEEKTLADKLEASARASMRPPTTVRRLRAGSAGARVLCREGRDDLVITIGYLPDGERPVLFAYDCLLDRELGVRGANAAAETALVSVLWDEHKLLVAQGVRERPRTRLRPRVRTTLIAGGRRSSWGSLPGF